MSQFDLHVGMDRCDTPAARMLQLWTLVTPLLLQNNLPSVVPCTVSKDFLLHSKSDIYEWASRQVIIHHMAMKQDKVLASVLK